MPEHLDLEDELVALGRTLVTEPPRDDLAGLVLARLPAPVSAEPAERAEPARRRATLPGRRLGWAIAAVVVLVIALIPPVRAAVVELLRIGGIVVREEPGPSPSVTPPTSPVTASPSGPATGARVSLERADQLIGSDIAVPTALGPPTSVVVAHEGRVAELTWELPSGTTRLDVFVGSLSWGYLKTVWQAVTPTRVKDHEAVWLGSPHLIEWVDREGGTHSEAPRLAGPTLVWVVPAATGEVTYRLEGPATLTDALRVAASAG